MNGWKRYARQPLSIKEDGKVKQTMKCLHLDLQYLRLVPFFLIHYVLSKFRQNYSKHEVPCDITC
jgi:hypothetical protein